MLGYQGFVDTKVSEFFWKCYDKLNTKLVDESSNLWVEEVIIDNLRLPQQLYKEKSHGHQTQSTFGDLFAMRLRKASWV